MKKASEKQESQASKTVARPKVKPEAKPAPKEKEAKSKTALSVSPSAGMVWEKCALSLLNVKSPFRLEQDEYAKQGTLLHEAIANTLVGGKVVLDDEEDNAIVRFAVETVKQEADAARLFIEAPLFTINPRISFSGTADCVFLKEDTVVIIDYKTGWKEVEAEGNTQLKMYAHLAVDNDTFIKNVKKWRGIIINARFNSVSYTGGEIEKDYLSKTAKDILARTAKKQFKVGNHCAYCQRLTTCAKVRAEITKWLKPGMTDGITREPERLAEALRLTKPAEKLFDAIKKEAQLFIDLGGEIPGVSIEYTLGQRAWPRDMNSIDIGSKIGLASDQMYTESMISPAEATRRGADKDAINAIAIRPPRKGFKFI